MGLVKKLPKRVSASKILSVMNQSKKLPSSNELKHQDLINRIESVVKNYNEELSKKNDTHSQNLASVAKVISENMSDHAEKLTLFTKEVTKYFNETQEVNKKKFDTIFIAIASGNAVLLAILIYLIAR